MAGNAKAKPGSSWISLPPHISGLGPDHQWQTLQAYEVLVWNAVDDPQSGTPINLDRLVRYAMKAPTSSGVVVTYGRKATMWRRGVLKATSDGEYSFFVQQAAGKPWYRKNWGSSSLALLVPNTNFPGWDRTAGTLSVGAYCENEAISRALDQVAGRKYDLSETLAGAVQTHRMLCETVTLLIRAAYDARRGRVSNALRRLGYKASSKKRAANLWLEVQYGWRPLVSDVMNGIEALKRQLESGDLLFTARGTATEKLGADWGFPGKPFTSALPFAYTHVDNKRSARVELVYSVSNPTARAFASWGIENPLYFGWVMLPWSFLVDWAIPVGKWLNGMSAALGTTFVDGWMSKRLQVDTAAEGVNLPVTNHHFGVSKHKPATMPKARMQVMAFQRDVLLTIPRPALYVSSSPFASPQRLLNAIALIEANRKGFR